MPYIKKEQRPNVDKLIDPIIEYLKSLPTEEQDGSVNYAVTKILIKLYPLKYFHLNRALGVLSAIQKEFYRVIVAPYEDLKIKENGKIE